MNKLNENRIGKNMGHFINIDGTNFNNIVRKSQGNHKEMVIYISKAFFSELLSSLLLISKFS